MAATIDPLLPLSLLEAVRFIDSPQDDFEAEFVQELRNKRFGLSETVYAQIRRYNDAVKRRQRSDEGETRALAKLIGRRPDAEAVFRSAGRHLAKETYLTVSPVRRRALMVLPAVAARPMALRTVRRIVHRYHNASISRVGASVILEVHLSMTLDAAPRLAGCAYYEAFFRELLRLLIGGTGAAEHVRCAGRGEGSCQWRAEWRRTHKPSLEKSSDSVD
jgi:predicted hydrocarbon binding protein